MNGRTAAIAIVASAVIGGAAMYWLQVYAFYDRLPETSVLRVTTETGVQPLSLIEFQGIDASSSPLRYRACARLAGLPEVAHATPATNADPLTAPGWFDCFDAEAIGTALKRGDATAYMSERDIHRGVDRIIAVFPDGRAYAWQQLNGTLED